MKNFNKSSQHGAISKILIILAVIMLVVIVAVYGVTKFITTKKSQVLKSENSSESASQTTEVEKPIYEVRLGDVKFLSESAENLGNVLKSQSSYENDLTTTERFIKVIIGAQNKGKNNVAQYSWDVGNIIDSDGRNFVSINDRAYSWLPRPDLCGALLKPEFKPVPCVKYYEVSKASNGLKIVVKATEPKKQESLMDLDVK